MSITARALIVVRKGRKRKPGPRHPCGQLIDPSKAEVTETEKAIAKVIAMRHPDRQGVAPDLRHDAKAETPLGRLELGGKITREQYEAGRWYAGVVLRYRQSIFAPNASPCSIAGAQIVGLSGQIDLDQDEAARRKSVYNTAFELLDRKGQRVAKAVAHVAVHDRAIDKEGLKLLVIGLEILAIHRGLTKPENYETIKNNDGEFRR